MSRARLAGFLASLLACACAAPEATELAGGDERAPREDVAAIARSIETARACTDAGGVWGRGGLSPEPFCNMRYPDAGVACRDAAECGGRCIAKGSPDARTRATGRCQTFTSQFGCYALIEDGRVGPTLCVD